MRRLLSVRVLTDGATQRLGEWLLAASTGKETIQYYSSIGINIHLLIFCRSGQLRSLYAKIERKLFVVRRHWRDALVSDESANTQLC